MTPAAIFNLGWKTFIMYGVFCLAMAFFVFFFIKETKGLTLEDMDLIFGAVDQQQRRNDIERILDSKHAETEMQEHREVVQEEQKDKA